MVKVITKGSLEGTSVLRTFTSLIIHDSSHTSHHTPLIIHHSPYTTHHTPLIIHHSSYTTHHTLLIIQFAPPPVGSSVNSSSSNKLLVSIALAPVSSGFNSSSSRQLQLQVQISWQVQHFVNLHVQISWHSTYARNAVFFNGTGGSEAGKSRSAERRLRDGLGSFSDHSRIILGHGRNRPSIGIRVFTCFLKCRFRGRHSTL